MTIENKSITIKIATIFLVISILLTCIIDVTNSYSSIMNRIQALEQAHDSYKQTFEQIVEKQGNNDIALAQIQTQLSGIQTILSEVKSKLFR